MGLSAAENKGAIAQKRNKKPHRERTELSLLATAQAQINEQINELAIN